MPAVEASSFRPHACHPSHAPSLATLPLQAALHFKIKETKRKRTKMRKNTISSSSWRLLPSLQPQTRLVSTCRPRLSTAALASSKPSSIRPAPASKRGNQSQFAAYSSVDSSRQGTSSLPPVNDTIYALSTAPGKAGIAAIRISGPSCLDVSKKPLPMHPSKLT